MTRRPNGRRVKIHHSYTISAAAEVLGVHKHTVSRWIRPGEFYCLSCRAPRRPALDIAEYRPRTASRGLLCGICPTCDRLIYRAVQRASIEQMRGGLDITFPPAERRIDDSDEPLSNVDFKQDEQE
jgi:hypothetical protein